MELLASWRIQLESLEDGLFVLNVVHLKRGKSKEL